MNYIDGSYEDIRQTLGDKTMLTLKFYQHNDDSHDVYSCERYKVTVGRSPPENGEEPEVAPLQHVVRMYRDLQDDNPYYETVGDRETHSHAFVVNELGKTIDTIR